MKKKMMSLALTTVLFLSSVFFIHAAGTANKNGGSYKDNKNPIIKLNMDESLKIEETDIYFIEDHISNISGNITDDSDIKTLNYKIENGKRLLVNETIKPNKEFILNKIILMEGIHKVTVTATDIYENISSYSIYIFNMNEQNANGFENDYNDDDQDGLMNYQEDFYGTNKSLKDTDKDGLSDYEELSITETDPLKKDTDKNGISDDKEDFDKDGLTNIEEIKLNGNPNNEDTDFDGLLDAKEKIIGTKLDEYDTDEDEISDYMETIVKTNPFVKDSNNNGILDGEEVYEINKTPEKEFVDENTVPSLLIKLKGKYLENLSIYELAEDDLFLPKEMPGFIGVGYNFDSGLTVNNALLTYKFNPELKKIKNFKPAIYWFDSENQTMNYVENQVVDLKANTVTTRINNLGIYILINKSEYDKVWKQDTTKNIDSTKDSDKDGLTDYQETNLRYFNGSLVGTDPFNKDTDGDGLLDSEEIIIMKNNNKEYAVMIANPKIPDTDGDGFSDYEEVYGTEK